MHLDLQIPISFLQLLHERLTSLQELRQRQQKPVQKNGSKRKHQVLDAQPCSYSISVIVNALQWSQLTSTGNRE